MQIKRLLKEKFSLKGVRIVIAVCLLSSLLITHFVVPQPARASSDTYLLDRVIHWPDGSIEHVQIDANGFFYLDGLKRRLVGVNITGYTPHVKQPYEFWRLENLHYLDRQLDYLESTGIRLVRVQMGYQLNKLEDFKQEAVAYRAYLDLFNKHKMLVVNGTYARYTPYFDNLENIDFVMHTRDDYTDTLSRWASRFCDIIRQYPNIVAICVENEMDCLLKAKDGYWFLTEDQTYTAEDAGAYMEFFTNTFRQKLDIPVTNSIMLNPIQPEIKQVCVDSADIISFNCYEPIPERLIDKANYITSMLNITNNWWCLELNYRGWDGTIDSSMFTSELIDGIFDSGATIALLHAANESDFNLRFFDTAGNPLPSFNELVMEIDRLQSPIVKPVLHTIGGKSASEGQLLSFTISATDPENDPLTYSASNLPPGAQFGGGMIRFSWNAVVDATKYRIEVNSSPTWESENRLYYADVGNVLSKEVSGFPNNGTVFHWRVWAGNNVGWGVPSSSSFINSTPISSSPLVATSPPYTACVSDSIAEIPTLSPVRDAYTYSAIDNPHSRERSLSAEEAIIHGTTIIFCWNACSGATRYFLEINSSASWNEETRFYYADVGNVLSKKLSSFPNDGTTYYWRVWAGNDTGWSKPVSSSFVNGIAGLPLSPTLSSPTRDSSVSGSAYTFSWTPAYGQAGIYLNVHFEVSDGEFIDFEDIAISVSNENTNHKTLRPIASGTYTQLEPRSIGSNYTEVDEENPDNWETIVLRHNDMYAFDTYELTNPSRGTGTITSVTIYAKVTAYNKDGLAKLLLCNDSDLYFGNEEYITMDIWQDISMDWIVNPGTNLPWTWNDIDNLQAGIALLGSESSGTVCSQVYAIVSHTTN